jgi:hypothetical protein
MLISHDNILYSRKSAIMVYLNQRSRSWLQIKPKKVCEVVQEVDVVSGEELCLCGPLMSGCLKPTALVSLDQGVASGLRRTTNHFERNLPSAAFCFLPRTQLLPRASRARSLSTHHHPFTPLSRLHATTLTYSGQ